MKFANIPWKIILGFAVVASLALFGFDYFYATQPDAGLDQYRVSEIDVDIGQNTLLQIAQRSSDTIKVRSKDIAGTQVEAPEN